MAGMTALATRRAANTLVSKVCLTFSNGMSNKAPAEAEHNDTQPPAGRLRTNADSAGIVYYDVEFTLGQMYMLDDTLNVVVAGHI